MISRQLVEAVAFSAPIVAAMVCICMMLADAYLQQRNREEKRLRLFLACTYVVTSLGWLGMVLYIMSPRFFVFYYSIFLLTLMLDQVMIYRFVSLITHTGGQYRFNRLHLVIPFFFTLISLLCDLLVPPAQQLAVIYGNGEGGSPSNMGFRIVYIGTGILFVIYNTLYPLLNLRHIRRYRQFIVNYSADVQRTSLNWLALIQVLILVTVPGPLAGLLLGVPLIATSYFVLLGAVPYFINYLIFCYNLLDNNYLIIQPEVPAQETKRQTTVLDREHFERYLCEKKPYLNPKLRIIDLAAELNTNRSYISGFINREYNMNFCRLVNYYRLKELDRLRQLPANATKTNIDLVLMSGFSSYRSYRSYLKTKEEGE